MEPDRGRHSSRGARAALAGALALALLGAALLGAQLILDLRTLQQVQAERAEIAHVRYGLLDADQWVARVSAVLSQRIQDFRVTEANRPALERTIEEMLDRLLREVETLLRQRNAQGEGWLERLQGSLRQGVQEWLVDFDALRARVPLYADAVLAELDRPQTRAEIERALLAALDDAAAASFARTDRSPLRAIEQRHGCRIDADCAPRLGAEAARLQRLGQERALALIALIAAMFALASTVPARDGPQRPRPLPPEVTALLAAATLVLLGTGVTTPMIELEARIDALEMTLLGEPVAFTDQVLFFQSKSILDVVHLLAATGAADLILVAALLALFSLVFPAAKLLASALYCCGSARLQGNALVRFFALRSGKWSMADVLVVAMLMAYIGFDGLVASQLAEIGEAGRNAEVMTTNGTRLQPGFFLFLAFVLSSLWLSALLETRRRGPEQAP